MVTVTMKYDAKGLYQGFTISGHADGGEGAEYDLICAAVSAVSLTTALGLQDVLGLRGTFDSSSGFLHVDLTSPLSEKSQVLMETMVHGLETIRDQYPGHLEIQK